MIPLPDSLLLGDGVFETFRIYKGHPFRLTKHLSRLECSAKGVDISDIPSQKELHAIVTREIFKAGLPDARCRISLYRQTADSMDEFPFAFGNINILIKSFAGYAPHLYWHGIKCVTLWKRLSTDQPPLWVKSTSCQRNILGRIEASHQNSEEGLFLTEEGMVAEGCFSNLFTVTNRQLITPPYSDCLPGITREEVLSIAREFDVDVIESKLSLTDVVASDEVFLTSSLAELIPVVKINEHQIGTGTPGVMYKALHACYRTRTKNEPKSTRC